MPRYRMPPIVEAAVSLRVRPAEGTSVGSLAAVRKALSPTYSITREQYSVEGTFSAGPVVSATATQALAGYVLLTADEKQVCHVKPNELTLSRLAPYSSWEELIGEFRKVWSDYSRFLKPLCVVRVGVRYINRLDISTKHAELSDYFRTFPEVSKDLPQELKNFFLRTEIPLDGDRLLIINQCPLAALPETVSVLLDLDVFRERVEFTKEDEIWRECDALRREKNGVFEACITDRAREMFKPCQG